MPLFLGQSGHVMRDVPSMIEELRQVHPVLSLWLVGAAGEEAGLLEALAAYCFAALMDGGLTLV